MGISDPTSIAGVAGVVDTTAIAQAHQAIKDGCETLLSPNSTQQQLLSAATVVAKHTSALCSACKVASSKTTNAVAKKHFVAAAKDVATRTAKLVHGIKVHVYVYVYVYVYVLDIELSCSTLTLCL